MKIEIKINDDQSFEVSMFEEKGVFYVELVELSKRAENGIRKGITIFLNSFPSKELAVKNYEETVEEYQSI